MKLLSSHAKRGGRRPGERGGAIVFAMVVVASIGLITSAGLSLMSAASAGIEERKTAVERRVRLANSEALAREVVRRKYVTAADGPAADETHTLPGGWGEVTISSWTGAPIQERDATRFHKTGAVPYRAFSKDVDVTLHDGDSGIPWQLQIRSVNPMLGGDLLVMHQPTLKPGENIKIKGDVFVDGRGVFWTGGDEHQVDIQADRYVGADPGNKQELLLEDTGGTDHLPENFPFVPMTGGVVDGAADYGGKISVIDNPDSPDNAYVQRFGVAGSERTAVGLDGSVEFEGALDSNDNDHPDFESDGKGDIGIDLSEPSLSTVHVIDNCKKLIFYGQGGDAEFNAAGNLPPVIVIVTNRAGSDFKLDRIECRERNNRRLIVAIRNERENRTDWKFEADVPFPEWRGIFELENVPVKIDIKGDADAVSLVGGIRTDRDFEVGGGDLYFKQETDPRALEILTSRQAWLETYRP